MTREVVIANAEELVAGTGIVSILAVIVAALSLIVAARSAWSARKANKKKEEVSKYELSESLRKDILDWYDRCVYILILLRTRLKAGRINDEKYLELNASLSSLVELGRFYFPNYDRDKDKGQDRPEAYKGKRTLPLDLLVKSYAITSKTRKDLLKKKDYFVSELEIYQEGFTSELFEVLDPDLYIEEHMKNTWLKIRYKKTFSESEYAPQNREPS